MSHLSEYQVGIFEQFSVDDIARRITQIKEGREVKVQALHT